MSFFSADPALAPYLAVVLLGFLPSEVWRVLSVFLARRIDEESEVFLFVRSVATVLLVGVVVKVVLIPSRELAIVPVWARCGAFAVAMAAFFAARRSVFAAILAGEAATILAAWHWAG
jgi:pilus assembly protein TadC